MKATHTDITPIALRIDSVTAAMAQEAVESIKSMIDEVVAKAASAGAAFRAANGATPSKKSLRDAFNALLRSLGLGELSRGDAGLAAWRAFSAAADGLDDPDLAFVHDLRSGVGTPELVLGLRNGSILKIAASLSFVEHGPVVEKPQGLDPRAAQGMREIAAEALGGDIDRCVEAARRGDVAKVEAVLDFARSIGAVTLSAYGARANAPGTNDSRTAFGLLNENTFRLPPGPLFEAAIEAHDAARRGRPYDPSAAPKLVRREAM